MRLGPNCHAVRELRWIGLGFRRLSSAVRAATATASTAAARPPSLTALSRPAAAKPPPPGGADAERPSAQTTEQLEPILPAATLELTPAEIERLSMPSRRAR
jgi:hypothetical protein